MLFGTSKGQILVNDVHGELVTQVCVIKDSPIIAMAWSCEKFKMEETELDGQPPNPGESQTAQCVVLAVAFESGVIYLMKNYDDLNPIVLHTGLKGRNSFVISQPRPFGITEAENCATLGLPFSSLGYLVVMFSQTEIFFSTHRHQTRMVELWGDARSCRSSRRNVLHFV